MAPAAAPAGTTPRARKLSNPMVLASPLGSPRRGSLSADAWLQAARSSILMRKLPQEAHGYLMRAAKMKKIEPGEVIYTEGDAPDAFYVVNAGKLRATTTTFEGNGQQLARELGPADTFGSHELILGLKKRAVTITCIEAGSVWTLPPKVFDAKIKVAPAPAPSLVSRIAAVPMFAGLSKEAQKQLCRAVQDAVEVKKGEKLATQGERSAVYMLESGQLKSVVDGNDERKTILKAPMSFGEASLYDDERSRVHESELTAWAGSATLMKFEAADIEALVGFDLQARAHRLYNRQLLGEVSMHGTPLMVGLADAEADWLATACVHEDALPAGADVIKQGEADEKLYVVRRGVATIVTDELGEVAELMVADGKHPFFGELALTGRRHRRTAGVCASSSAASSADGGLLVLSLSSSLVKTNPKLVGWMTALDAIAEDVAQKEAGKKGGKPSSVPLKPHQAAAAKAAAMSERANPASQPDFDRAGAMLKRRSFGELLVEAKRSTIAASARAKRNAAISKKKQENAEKKNSATQRKLQAKSLSTPPRPSANAPAPADDSHMLAGVHAAEPAVAAAVAAVHGGGSSARGTPRKGAGDQSARKAPSATAPMAPTATKPKAAKAPPLVSRVLSSSIERLSAAMGSSKSEGDGERQSTGRQSSRISRMFSRSSRRKRTTAADVANANASFRDEESLRSQRDSGGSVQSDFLADPLVA